MNPSVALTTGSLSRSSTTSGPQFIPPMTEETIEKTSQRIQSSIRDVGIIARELLKGSRSEEVLAGAAKQMLNHEHNIESCSLSVQKLELISQQIALHQECIEQALANIEDVEWKLNRIVGQPAQPSSSSSTTPKRPKNIPLAVDATEVLPTISPPGASSSSRKPSNTDSDVSSVVTGMENITVKDIHDSG